MQARRIHQGGVVSYEGMCMHIKCKGACRGQLCTNGGRGFLLSVMRSDFLRDDFSQEHAVCPLSGIKKVRSWEVTY